jgi:hypothetical protein
LFCPNRLQQSHGFGLIELLFTQLMIIILYLSISNNWFSFGKNTQRRLLLSKISAINHLLHTGQVLAISRQQTVSLQPLQQYHWQTGLALYQEKQLLTQLQMQAVRISWHGFQKTQNILIQPSGFTLHNGHFSLSSHDYSTSCQLYINHALKTHHICS